MTLTEVWGKAQRAIKERVGSATYETWFSPMQIKEKNAGALVVETPDEFFKNWIVEHYAAAIQDSVDALSEKNISIEYTVNPHILKQDTQNRLTEFEKGFQGADKQSRGLNSR